MDTPLVSVVVISYNHAHYILENLDSIKNQTYKNWELIVADDASADNSVEKFETWLDENGVLAKKIFHKNNTGLASVLNEALEICSGEFIKFIAADDFLHPDCLEKSAKYLQEKGPNYGMVFTDTFCIDENSNPLPDLADYNKLGLIPAEEFRAELLKGNRIAALTVLMRTEVVKETGKYDAQFIVEDYFRWLKISEKYLIGYIPEKLSYYRLHAENISKTKAERIGFETIMLQIMFDKKGSAKNTINYFIQTKYLRKEKIPKDLLVLYNSYPFKSKRLKIFIKYHFPQLAYRAINKFV